MCIKDQQQNFKDQFLNDLKFSKHKQQNLIKMNNEKQTDQRRLEACHQIIIEKKIKRIKNSKHFFRLRLVNTLYFLIHHLFTCLFVCIHQSLHKSTHKSTHKSPHKSTHKSLHKSLYTSLHYFLFNFIHKALFNFISNCINFCSNDLNLIAYLYTNYSSNLNSSFCTIQMVNLISFINHIYKFFKINLKFKFHNQPFKIQLFMFALLFNNCYANESCFGGIETFEKTSMVDFNTEIKPTGTLLQQNDQALTRDCINLCKNQHICLSFGLDYKNFICAAYTYTSSQTIAPNHHLRDKLQLTNTTSFFEKVCFKGMSREEYQRICGLERLWAFERVMDAFLDGFEDLSIPGIANKDDCAKQCLIETTFNCRSADYDHTSKICRLSREDRRTQPQAFRQVFGSKRDYLENQCAAAGLFFLIIIFKN